MFTRGQVNQILNNKNVDKCSPKSVTYNSKFKIEAVRKYYEQGYSPSMIFREAGFDSDLVSNKKAKDCLQGWRKIYNSRGESALAKENRGGPGRRASIKSKNDKEKIEYLETKIAYLKTENDFLKKMKKLKKP